MDFTTLEPKDAQFIPAMVNFKSSNPRLKVVASIGGWNFPSAFFSRATQPANVHGFTKAVAAFIHKYHLDGIDFDWEYPCAAPRVNQVKITCYKFD